LSAAGRDCFALTNSDWIVARLQIKNLRVEANAITILGMSAVGRQQPYSNDQHKSCHRHPPEMPSQRNNEIPYTAPILVHPNGKRKRFHGVIAPICFDPPINCLTARPLDVFYLRASAYYWTFPPRRIPDVPGEPEKKLVWPVEVGGVHSRL